MSIYKSARIKNIVFLLSIGVLFLLLNSCLSNQAPHSRNSLAWQGIYNGIIPAADGPGIDVRLRLNSNETFELRYEYLGRSNAIFNWEGSFTWDKKGTIITLDLKDMPRYYMLDENKLIQLDMKGKKIKGELADNYILKKI